MEVRTVAARLAKGDHLHLGFSSGQRSWWFEGPFHAIPEHVVHAAVRDGAVAVVEAGDSLFGFKGNSQTRLVEEGSDVR